MTVVRDVARHKLDLVDVQEVMWEKGGTVEAEDFFSMKKETKIIH